MLRPNTVQVYLLAKSIDEIILEQQRYNIYRHKAFNYSVPQKIGGNWVVWLFDDVTDWVSYQKRADK